MIIREEEGDYSAIALNLPGAGSCGDTIDEAIEHAKEAVQTAIKSYEDDGVEIPWDNDWKNEVPSGTQFLQIVID